MSMLEERADVAQATLFAGYDELKELWEAVEAQLTRHHIPHDVGHTYYYPGDEQEYDIDPYEKQLGMAKAKGKWRLCHSESHINDQSERDWTPIVECSAWLRVRMVRYIPKLREAVVAGSERFIPEVQRAIAALRKELLAEPPTIPELLAERAKLNGKHP